LKTARATVALAILLALLVVAVPGCGREVINVTMRRDSFVLYDVCAVDRNHVWAVGGRGQILFYDGKRWTSQKSGTEKVLFGVSATDPEHVWAVGEKGTVLFFDGSKWSKRSVPTGATLYDCAALEGGRFWAVGTGPILSLDGNGWSLSETDRILRGVTATDDGQVWAAGDGGVLYYDGVWKEQFSCKEKLTGISAVDGTHVWAVGYSEWAAPVQVSTVFCYDGLWRQDRQFPDCQFRGVFALRPDSVWVAGIGGNVFFDGSGWKKTNSTNYESYYGVSALSPDKGWVVGSELGGKLVDVPTILTYDGRGWTRYAPPW
jgi:photosystem II stability/assembly factor-like uncharacterized protein